MVLLMSETNEEKGIKKIVLIRDLCDLNDKDKKPIKRFIPLLERELKDTKDIIYDNLYDASIVIEWIKVSDVVDCLKELEKVSFDAIPVGGTTKGKSVLWFDVKSILGEVKEK